MPGIESPEALSEQTEEMFSTGTAGDDSLAVTERERREDRERWNFVIDQRLVEWGRNPAQLEDEDIEPPMRRAVEAAIQSAIRLREHSPAPLRVVPNGEGGVVFEWRAGDFLETLEASGDGSLEYAAYYRCRLQRREPVV